MMNVPSGRMKRAYQYMLYALLLARQLAVDAQHVGRIGHNDFDYAVGGAVAAHALAEDGGQFVSRAAGASNCGRNCANAGSFKQTV